MRISNNYITTLFLILAHTTFYGQYTEIINSNKPGFSESPYSVGSGVYQFENSFFYKNTKVNTTFSRPISYGVDVHFRTGLFFEKLELNSQITFQEDKVVFSNIYQSHYFEKQVSNLKIGVKYLIYQQKISGKSKEIRSWKKRHAFDYKTLIPSVALYSGVSSSLVDNFSNIGDIIPRAGILLQNDLVDNINIINNFFYNFTDSNAMQWSHIITATINFNSKLSMFIEKQTTSIDNNVGGGFAFLLSRNFQINSAARYVSEGGSKGFFGSIGCSFRIDTHEDTFIELDENGQKVKKSVFRKKRKKRRKKMKGKKVKIKF